MNEQKQLEFLIRLINETPDSSLLKVNGFYSEFISLKNFQKLFPTISESDRSKIVNYIIPLTIEFKKILVSIIEDEKEQLIYDLAHFCIENKGETLFISHDGMEYLQIKSKRFPELEKDMSKDFNSLEIQKVEREINSDFFKHINESKS